MLPERVDVAVLSRTLVRASDRQRHDNAGLELVVAEAATRLANRSPTRLAVSFLEGEVVHDVPAGAEPEHKDTRRVSAIVAPWVGGARGRRPQERGPGVIVARRDGVLRVDGDVPGGDAGDGVHGGRDWVDGEQALHARSSN